MRTRSLRSLLVVAAALAFSGCEPETGATPPRTIAVGVQPQFVCAGEEVAVSWDAGDQTDSPACRPGLVGSGVGADPSRSECIFIDRTSAPVDASWDQTGDLTTQGSRGTTIDATTTFTARAFVADFGGRPYEDEDSATVTVIEETEPPGPTTLPFQFAGTCVGARPAWEDVPLKNLTSGCLEVLDVCNASASTIRLTDVEDPGRTVTLAPGATSCTEIFSGRAPNLSGSIEGFEVTPGMCGAEMTTGMPPPFGIIVRVQCNRDMPTCAF